MANAIIAIAKQQIEVIGTDNCFPTRGRALDICVQICERICGWLGRTFWGGVAAGLVARAGGCASACPLMRTRRRVLALVPSGCGIGGTSASGNITLKLQFCWACEINYKCSDGLGDIRSDRMVQIRLWSEMLGNVQRSTATRKILNF